MRRALPSPLRERERAAAMAFKPTRRRTPARAGLGECRRRSAPRRLAPLRRVDRPGVERAPDGQSLIGPVADKLCSSARRDRDFVRSLLCRPRRPSARPCCQAGRLERAEPGAPGPFARCIRRADVRDLAGASACLVRRGASDRAVRCSSLPPCRRPAEALRSLSHLESAPPVNR